MDNILPAVARLFAGLSGQQPLGQACLAVLSSALAAFEMVSLASWSEAEDPLLEAVKEQLELFPETKFSIDDMARAVWVSKYYFIRRFKQAVGLTPHQFQLQNRIRKAQRLISQNVTLTEAALTTGFCDQSHFIKQFEKLVGLTPSAYQRSAAVIPSADQQRAGMNLANK